MSRAVHPAVKAAAAAKHVPVLANHLAPLAQEVGKRVVREVTVSSHTARKAAKGSTGPSLVMNEPDVAAFKARITALVTKVFEQALSSPTPKGKARRMALIAGLAKAEAGGMEAPLPTRDAPADTLLTTAEAAAKLEVSRPYVSMLCDSGKLGEVVMTEGGHRRIKASAVQAYLAARTMQHKGAVSPRQAGVEAGLYDYPETDVKVVRGAESVRKAVSPKAAREPRS